MYMYIYIHIHIYIYIYTYIHYTYAYMLEGCHSNFCALHQDHWAGYSWRCGETCSCFSEAFSSVLVTGDALSGTVRIRGIEMGWDRYGIFSNAAISALIKAARGESMILSSEERALLGKCTRQGFPLTKQVRTFSCYHPAKFCGWNEAKENQCFCWAMAFKVSALLNVLHFQAVSIHLDFWFDSLYDMWILRLVDKAIGNGNVQERAGLSSL